MTVKERQQELLRDYQCENPKDSYIAISNGCIMNMSLRDLLSSRVCAAEVIYTRAWFGRCESPCVRSLHSGGDKAKGKVKWPSYQTSVYCRQTFQIVRNDVLPGEPSLFELL